MAKTYPIIKAVSNQIKNSTTAASNTAAIVGGNLGDILDKVEEVDLAKVPTTRKVNSKVLSADIALDKTDVGLGNVDNTSDANKPVSDATNTLVTNHTTRTDNPHTVTKTQVGLGNVDNTSDADKPISNAVDSALDLKADLIDGKVPVGQLPAYVDDVLEYANLAAFPVTGESGKIYVALETNLTYRWGGSAYTEISKSLALGETSTTAYRGDRGKTAYDHSQLTGNAHGTTAAQIANTPAGTIAATTVQAAINELDADRVQLETDLNLITGKDYTPKMEIGYALIPSSTTIGDIITISRSASSIFNSIKIKVVKGEKVTITGSGGIGPRLYYVTDNSYKLKIIANESLSGIIDLVFDEDGYVVLNARNDNLTYSPNLLAHPISSILYNKVEETENAIEVVSYDVESISAFTIGKNYASEMEANYSLIPSSTTVGDVISISRTVKSGVSSIKIKVLNGEKVIITGIVGAGVRLYYTTDNYYNLKSIANSGISGTFVLTINEDGYLIFNANTVSVGYPRRIEISSLLDKIQEIDNKVEDYNDKTTSSLVKNNIIFSVNTTIGIALVAGILNQGYPARATTDLLKSGINPLYFISSNASLFTIRYALYSSDGLTVIGYNDQENESVMIPPNSYFRVCFVKVSGNIIDINEILNIVSSSDIEKAITKNWYALGDSIIEGYISYLNNGTPTSSSIPSKCWVKKLSEIRKDLVLTNYGVGGQGWLDPAGGVSTTAREKVDSVNFTNCDICTLAYGINDWKGNKIVGTINDSPALGTTVISNMKYCIEKIISDNPACKIYIISPLNCMGYSFDFGNESTNYALGYTGFANTGTLDSFFSKIKEVAEYYGVEFIDMTHNSIVNRKSLPALLIDGVHPSEQCHLAIARELAYKI